MKLTIGEFEVEIKAHARCVQRNNKHDAMLFLNEISTICDAASREAKANERKELSKRYYNLANDIYRALKESGAYQYT